MNKNDLALWTSVITKTAEQLDSSEFVAAFNTLEQLAPNLVEEALEVSDAVENVNLIEVIDGVIDVAYVNTQAWIALEKLGVNMNGAWRAICANNDAKLFDSYKACEQEAFDYNLHVLEEDSVEAVGVTVGDKVVWSLRRERDGKLCKPVGHKKVSLVEFIPKELLC